MFERKKTSGKLLSLPIDQIHPSPFQARKSFDEQELTALAQSIRENGLLQPVTVRKVAEGYELVAGERRLRACQLAKMTTIPAILCSYADDRTAALGLLENIQRADLNPFEQAQGLKDVMVLWDCTQAEAAKAAIRHFSHRDGLQQTIFTDALGQRSQLLLAELPPCLKRRRPDLIDGQEINLARLLFAFKHGYTAPFAW